MRTHAKHERGQKIPMTICEWCGHEHDVTALCTKRPRWSRRGFLSLVGLGAVGLAVGGIPTLGSEAEAFALTLDYDKLVLPENYKLVLPENYVGASWVTFEMNERTQKWIWEEVTKK